MNTKRSARIRVRGSRSVMVTLVVAGLLLTGPVSAAPVVTVGGDTGHGPAPTEVLPAEAAMPDGTALVPPASSRKKLLAAQSKRDGALPQTTPGAPATPVPLLFATADPTRSDVAEKWRPYHRLAPVQLGFGVRDATGVRMYKIGTTMYDHPVLQAADGIDSFESWLLTKDKRYIDQALGDAHRLVDRRVESRGAWFFPYPFDFALHGDKTDVIRTPWYSAMAQGQALSLFARLQAQTKDPQWGLALTQTLASLSLGPTADAAVPFVSWVDGNNRLWLEEYAQLPLSRSDRTINGHIFAMFGLWDAVRLTADPEAERLFRGAAATIRRYVYDGVRRTFWISSYCLTHGVLDSSYHRVVIQELRYLHAITGSSDWARFADRFRDDYPRRDVKGVVLFAAGTVTGQRFDSQGRVYASRTLRLSRASQAPADRRERIFGRGYFYRVTAGPLAGYYVAEAYPSVRMVGVQEPTTYAYARVVTFRPGPSSAYMVNETTGALSSPLSGTFSRSSAAHFDRSAWIGGRLLVHLADGWFSGRWAPAGGLVLS